MSRIGEYYLGDQYPATPGFKEPTTSRDAALAFGKEAKNLRALVLAAIKQYGGLTADEVARKLNMDRLAIRPRCSELRFMGKIENSNHRRVNDSGLRAIVWRAK